MSKKHERKKHEHEFDEIARKHPTAALITLDTRVTMLEADLTVVEDKLRKLCKALIGKSP
jgi:hypothetical protein